MNRIRIAVLVMVALFAFSSVSFATLWDRGNGLIYDDVLDITWLQDANYAGTSGYTASLNYQETISGDPIPAGRMSQSDAMTWAANLSYAGFDDWRLPTTAYPGYGFNITTSELGYMYYVNLGNVADNSVTNNPLNVFFTDGNDNLVSFINLQPIVYFMDVENSAFSFDYGLQSNGAFSNAYQGAWAVRSGDVVSSNAPVPEPGTMILFGIGLAGLGATKFRRKKK